MRDLFDRAGVQPAATHVIEHAEYGYTTNLPLADITADEAIVAYAYEGEEIEPIHGGPVRIVVPHLYFWKSAKWVRGLELRDRRRARLLGAQRLPHVRRPVPRAAPLGRLSRARLSRPRLGAAQELAASARRPSITSGGRRGGRRRHGRWCSNPC